MIIIALTGNIACGKSTISAYWREIYHGGTLVSVDTDQLASAVIEPGTDGNRQLLSAFSSDRDAFVDSSGQINRRELGRLIFNDVAKKRQLERITWPLVHKQLHRRLASAFFRGVDVLVIEIPQLFESLGPVWPKRIFHAVVTVVCSDRTKQLEQLLARNPDISRSDAEGRLRAQMSQEDKARLSTAVIDCSGSLESSKEQAGRILDEICRKNRFHFAKQLIVLIGLPFCAIVGIIGVIYANY